jgi:hypothetical protein
MSIAGFAATSKALETYGADEPNGSGPKWPARWQAQA